MKPTTAKSGRQTDIRIALPWHSELGPICPAIDAPAYEATNRRMVVYEGMVRQPHTEHLIAHIHRLHLPRDRLNPHMLTPTQFLSFGRSDCRELRVDVSLNDPIGPLPREASGSVRICPARAFRKIVESIAQAYADRVPGSAWGELDALRTTLLRTSIARWISFESTSRCVTNRMS